MCSNAKAVNVKPERCFGRGDIFEFELWSDGQQLCGYYFATGNLGDQVDESGDTPPIVGRKQGGAATVAFVNGSGVKGVASIELIGNSLHWRILSQDSGSSLLPTDALLNRRQGSSRWHGYGKCSG